jgi:hypothetical protein
MLGNRGSRKHTLELVGEVLGRTVPNAGWIRSCNTIVCSRHLDTGFAKVAAVLAGMVRIVGLMP